jgi:signal transduction histidine kinase
LAGSVRVLLRAGNGAGPCAYILAEGTTEPWLGGILPATHVWLLPLAGVLAVVLLAAGPLVRRIRRLEMAIRRSAEGEYAREVPTLGDDEVSALARAFNEAGGRVRTALERARRNEAALREFVANTVHDVMIPLTVLLGHLAELQRRAVDQRPTDKETVGHVMSEAHYLGALINNLAVAAKLDAGESFLQLSEVDLCALVERVVSRHKPLAVGLEVSLDHAVPGRTVTVSGDVTLLEQAVGNVVYNAIRYNRAGGHVAVLLEAATTAPSTFLLSVVDDGPGMSDEELARAVERGFRGEEARTRAPGGTGLGLDIAHRVAALHGLDLTFSRSQYGGLQVELAGPRGVRPLDVEFQGVGHGAVRRRHA